MKNILISLCLFKLLALFVMPALSDESLKPEQNLDSDTTKISPSDPTLNMVLTNNYIHMSDEVSRLETMVLNQNKAIEELQNQLSNQSARVDENIDFPVWTSFLLASAALITGGVGIIVAILSFIGYRKIISKSTEIAQAVATKIAIEKIDMETRSKTIQAVNDYVESGLLNQAIDERISEIIYRGVGDVSAQDGGTAQADEVEGA